MTPEIRGAVKVLLLMELQRAKTRVRWRPLMRKSPKTS